MGTRLLALLLLWSLTAVPCFVQADETPQEYVIKARYLLNIPLFTENAFPDNGAKPYTICLIGDTPLAGVLEPFGGRMIKKRPLTIRKVDNLSQADGCQMLFIASTERHRVQPLLAEAHRQGILTISDMRDFARLGGIISLLVVDNRIAFDLNRSAAGKASISFSTHLLKLARDIIY
jgi:hypothetical protein